MAHTAPTHARELDGGTDQLSAINKAFIPTVDRSTGHSSDFFFKKKRKGKKEKIFFSTLHLLTSLLFCVYIHPLHMESPGFEIF